MILRALKNEHVHVGVKDDCKFVKSLFIGSILLRMPSFLRLGSVVNLISLSIDKIIEQR